MPGTAAVLAVGAYTANYQAKKAGQAAEAQQRSDEKRAVLEKKRAALKSARARTQAVRQARAAKGEALAQAQIGAGTGGSGLIGVRASVDSQLNEGVAFMNQNQNISNNISSLNIAAAKTQAGFQQDINRAGAINSVFQTGASIYTANNPNR